MTIGEPFNPHRRFNGVFIPLGVLRCRDISDGAKLLYGRLCMFAGKDGECFADREQIAREMGSHVATVGRQIEELVTEEFIRRVRRGPGLTAKCEFLWHPALESCLRGSDSARMRGQKHSPDSAKVRGQERSDSAETRHQEEIQTAQECAPDSAKVRGVIKEEKTPLKDSLTPGEILETTTKTSDVKILTPLEGKIARTAQDIHQRHPAVRRCGLREIRKALEKIVRRVQSPDRLALLDTVIENHRLWCLTQQWTKDGGEYAKGLENWLAPTMERYLTQPEAEAGGGPSMKPPPTEYPSANEYLRRIASE